MKDYKELNIWKMGICLVKEVYSVTRQLPESEKFGLVSQMQQSAVSVPSNIAEGYGRNTDKELSRSLDIFSWFFI